jgi:hypothetical protein
MIVEGTVADDKITQRIRFYLEDVVSKEAFLDELKFFRRTHQICFCTHCSLQALERIRKKKFAGNIDDAITQSLATDYNLSEEKAIDVYFESQTCRMLIDESSALYRKPWTEIYELLLQELKMKQIKLELVICTAGHPNDFLEETGIAESIRNVMLDNRLGVRFGKKEMIILGGTLELEVRP